MSKSESVQKRLQKIEELGTQQPVTEKISGRGTAR